ncbi:MAG: Protein translocase subunit SecY, partial [uncultured Nocardioidaceae bacterium]
ARRLRQRVPHPGPAAQAAAGARDHRDLPVRLPAAGSRGQRAERAVLRQPGAEREPLRADQPVLRRCPAAAHRLRAGHHALHHREHHPAAAGRRDPAARGPQEGGPGGSEQDHAVHPLRHAGAGDPAGHRHRGAGPVRSAAPVRPAAALRQRHRHDADHGRDHDRRHLGDHVVRRADHRPRHRQRHVDPDLHAGRRHLPGVPVGAEDGAGLGRLRDGDRDRPGDRRHGHLHGAGPATDPGAVRPPHGRPEDVRRLLDVHPAQGEPGRHHPGDLLVQPALPAGAGDAVRPAGQQPDHAVGLRLPRAWRPPVLHAAVLRPDGLLHLLLRLDHLQPRGGRRQHEEVRRLHPRHPGGPADRGVPLLRPVPDHRPRCDVPRTRRADPADRAGARRGEPELPLRRHLDPHHGRRRARHGEADREPAPAAELRRIPPL